jgi:hypothetical protein
MLQPVPPPGSIRRLERDAVPFIGNGQLNGNVLGSGF